MQTIDEALDKLQQSKFRSSFHLTKKDKQYVNEKGRDTIKQHARDFVKQRLAPAYIENDGRQTPMNHHPVFKAQHGTATCCRGCMHTWYHVPLNTPLTEVQQEKIVNLIMAWIDRQMEQ